MKVVGGWDFYIIKSYHFGKVLKCIELSGISQKGKWIEFKGTEGVVNYCCLGLWSKANGEVNLDLDT